MIQRACSSQGQYLAYLTAQAQTVGTEGCQNLIGDLVNTRIVEVFSDDATDEVVIDVFIELGEVEKQDVALISVLPVVPLEVTL